MSDQNVALTSDDLLFRLRKRARNWADVNLTSEQVIALAACAEALKPFAAMDRPGCDPKELAVKRGIASDMTFLTSGDFKAAADAIAKLEAL